MSYQAHHGPYECCNTYQRKKRITLAELDRCPVIHYSIHARE
ncbi:hypothetical protein TI01_2481 [Lysobacter sp. A03]|nr:hypothetical protein TI01_2481 [Lysobacter sp. A03]